VYNVEMNDIKSKNHGGALLWIIVVVAIIITIISVAYYHKSSVEKARKEKERSELIKKIAEAKEKAKLEAAKLKQVQDVFLGDNPGNAFVASSFPLLSDIVEDDIDQLFNTPNSTPDLKIKAKSKSIEEKIEAERLKIKEALDRLKKQSQDVLKKVFTPAEVTQIRNDVNAVEDFIENLQDIVDGLTPGNSGLTQEEIEEYEDIVDGALEEIQEIIDNLPPSTPTIPTNPANPSNPTNPSPSSSPSVTPEDIQEQQEIVDEAEEVVENLEEELAALPSPSPSPSANPSQSVGPGNSTTPSPSPSDEPYTGGNDGSEYVPPVIQYNGVPKLLQGQD
jgi:hypothetical protein